MVAMEWMRGPVSGRWILYADDALWPRAELFTLESGGLVVVVFIAPEADDHVVGSYVTLIEAQAAAERALMTLVAMEGAA